MARCSTCLGEFEGARQPNCPLCGASRPRPRVRMPEKPPELEATVVALRARAEQQVPERETRKEKRRRRRERSVPSDPLGQRLAPIAAVPAPAVQTDAVAAPAAAAPVAPPAVRPQERVAPRPAQPPKALGPPPIDVEYVFGGAEPDVITLVSSIAVLEKVEEFEPDGPQHDVLDDLGEKGKKALSRAKTVFRRG
jgi:hypothetical protein